MMSHNRPGRKMNEAGLAAKAWLHITIFINKFIIAIKNHGMTSIIIIVKIRGPIMLDVNYSSISIQSFFIDVFIDIVVHVGSIHFMHVPC